MHLEFKLKESAIKQKLERSFHFISGLLLEKDSVL